MTSDLTHSQVDFLRFFIKFFFTSGGNFTAITSSSRAIFLLLCVYNLVIPNFTRKSTPHFLNLPLRCGLFLWLGLRRVPTSWQGRSPAPVPSTTSSKSLVLVRSSVSWLATVATLWSASFFAFALTFRHLLGLSGPLPEPLSLCLDLGSLCLGFRAWLVPATG